MSSMKIHHLPPQLENIDHDQSSNIFNTKNTICGNDGHSMWGQSISPSLELQQPPPPPLYLQRPPPRPLRLQQPPPSTLQLKQFQPPPKIFKCNNDVLSVVQRAASIASFGDKK